MQRVRIFALPAKRDRAKLLREPVRGSRLRQLSNEPPRKRNLVMASGSGRPEYVPETCPYARMGCPFVKKWKTTPSGVVERRTGAEIRSHIDEAHPPPANFYEVGPCAARSDAVAGGFLPCTSCGRYVRARAARGGVTETLNKGLMIVELQRHRSDASTRRFFCPGKQLTISQMLILASQVSVDAGGPLTADLAGTCETWEADWVAAEAAATRGATFSFQPKDDPRLLGRFFELLAGGDVAPLDPPDLASSSYGGTGALIAHDDDEPPPGPRPAAAAAAARPDGAAAAADGSSGAATAAASGSGAPRRGRSGHEPLSAPSDPLASPLKHARLAAAAARAHARLAAAGARVRPQLSSGSRPSLAEATAALRAGSEAALAALGPEPGDFDGERAYADSARAAATESRDALREQHQLARLCRAPHCSPEGEIGAAGVDVNGCPPMRDSPQGSPIPSREPSPPPPQDRDPPPAGADAGPHGGDDDGGDGDDDDEGGGDGGDALPDLPPSAGYPKPELGGSGIPRLLNRGHVIKKTVWQAAVVQTICDINEAFQGSASGEPNYAAAASSFTQLLALAPTPERRLDARCVAIMGEAYFDAYVDNKHVNPALPDTGPPPPAAPADAGKQEADMQARIRAAADLLAASRFGAAAKMLEAGRGPRHDFSTKHGQDAINALHPRQEDGGFPSTADFVHPPSPFGDNCSINHRTMGIDDDTKRLFKIDLTDYDPEVDGERGYVHALAVAICPALAKLLAAHKDSSAGGLDGWSYKALLAAFRAPDDPASATRQSHLAPLAEFLLHILSGKTGKSHFRFFYSELRGNALQKPNRKPRPLGIPALFLRLVHAIGLRLFRPAWVAATDAQDLGLKHSGCEGLAHMLQMTLSAGGAVHTTDASNAFNNINTQAVLNVGNDIPPLAPCINALYGNERDILYLGHRGAVEHKISGANRGILAGDSLGTTIFDVAYSKALASARAAAAEEGCIVPSIHDDLYVASPGGAEAAFKVMNGHVKPAGAAIGVSQNKEKTFLIMTSTDAARLSEATTHAAANGVALKTDGTIAGGIPIGTPAFIIDHLDAASDKVVKYIKQIVVYAQTTGAAPDPAALPSLAAGAGRKGGLQGILTLQRMTAAAKFAHFLRGVDPALSRLSARKIDQAVFDAVMELLGHRLDTLPPVGSERHWALYTRVFLPVSMGGLGFVSLEASRIPAFVASCQATAHIIHNASAAAGGNFIDGSDIRDKIGGLRDACEELASPLYGGGGPDALASKLEWRNIDKNAAHPGAEGLQSRLMRPFYKGCLARLLAAAPPHEKIALLSASDHHSGAFLLPSGGNQLLVMSDDDLRIAINFRLGLDVVDAGAGGGAPAATRTCPSCHRPMNARGAHAFTSGCPSSHGVPPTRHAAVTSAIRTVLARAPTGKIAFVGRAGNKEGTPLRDLPGWEPTAAGAEAAARVDAAHAAAPAGGPFPHNECTRADVVISLRDPAGGEERTIAIDATATAAVQILQANGGPIHDDLLSKSGAAAAHAEALKTRKYKDFWKFQKNAFLALGFEVLGAASPNVATFIECASLAAHPGIGPSKSDYDGKRAAFVSMMRQLISVRLQTANAAAIKRWRDACWNKAVPVPAAAGAGAAAP